MTLRSENPTLARFIEKQLRNWELARDQRLQEAPAKRKEVEDFISISRSVGVDGAALAAVLGARLRWSVFDKQLLHAMAGDDQVRSRLYQSMDERDLGWFEETVRTLMHDEFTKNDYFHKLTETVLSIARQGHAIFLGRATDLILPADRGFRVRVVAPLETCVLKYAQESSIPVEEARKEVQRIESARAEFVRHHFRVDPLDQSRYDLILNLDRFSVEQAADVIESALMMRGITE